MNKKSEAIKNWRKRTKRRIIESFGGSCCICGYDRCDEALSLHHLKPEEKEISFGSIRATPIAWPKIVIELRKCILVCNNCHAEIHYGILEIPVDVKRFDESFVTYDGYLKTEKKEYLSKCPICGKEKPVNQKTCSYKCAGKLSWKIDWDKIDLRKKIKEKSIVSIAEELHCSDAAVHKRLKKIGLK